MIHYYFSIQQKNAKIRQAQIEKHDNIILNNRRVYSSGNLKKTKKQLFQAASKT